MIVFLAIVAILVILYLSASWITEKVLFIGSVMGARTKQPKLPLVVAKGEATLDLAVAGTGNKLLVMFHGNGGSLDFDWRKIAKKLCTALTNEWVVVTYDYRGFGHSSGTSTVQNCKQDALELVRTLIAWYEPSALLLYGCSLGGAVALSVAGAVPSLVSGIFLEVPMLGMNTVKVPGLSWISSAFDVTSDCQVVKTSAIPTVVVLASHDLVLSTTKQREVLTTQLPQAKVFSVTSGHNNVSSHVVLRRELGRFCATIEKQ